MLIMNPSYSTSWNAVRNHAKVLPSLEAIKKYRTQYPMRPANLAEQINCDEQNKIGVSDGVAELIPPPPLDPQLGDPPESREKLGKNTYLWVITPDGVPFILEKSTVAKTLMGQRVVHTNLTGGNDAHCGGELWFFQQDSFWMSGGSSRYQARSKNELDAIETAFKNCGYAVISLGWDDDLQQPARVFRA